MATLKDVEFVVQDGLHKLINGTNGIYKSSFIFASPCSCIL